jgi:hypothetical protein
MDTGRNTLNPDSNVEGARIRKTAPGSKIQNGNIY